MTLKNCIECGGQVSDQTDFCPHCGYRLRIIPQADVSTGICPTCLEEMGKIQISPNGGVGCILIILGLCLAPLIIGIPVAIYGLILSSEQENYWQCLNCGARYHREPKSKLRNNNRQALQDEKKQIRGGKEWTTERKGTGEWLKLTIVASGILGMIIFGLILLTR